MAVRQTKLYIEQKVILNKLDGIVSSAPPYIVSEDLKVRSLSEPAIIIVSQSISFQKNIDNYAFTVLLSTKLPSYKGERTTKILLVCIHFFL